MKTIVFDFDGVIHSYITDWRGDTVIPDPPVPGIKETIDKLRGQGYKVMVQSARAATHDGKMAILMYLAKHKIQVDGVTHNKPPAIVYIDDRAICFDGNAENLIDKINNFKPWNR